MDKYFLLLVIVGHSMVHVIVAEKILLIAGSTYSHCAEVGSVGQELANRGHDVFTLLSVKFKHNDCFKKGANSTNTVKPIFLTPKEGVISVENMTKKLSASMIVGEEFSILTRLSLMIDFVRNICEDILSDTKTITSLDKQKFDLVIIDSGFMTYCFLAIPYKLKVPFISMSTVYEDIVIGKPYLPSIVPDFNSRNTDLMTFTQRLLNSIYPLLMHAMARYLLPMDVVRNVAPDLTVSGLINFVSKSELFLYNYDPILSYPQPEMPNIKMVGGISTLPAKPLSGEIREYYEKTTDGVVLVTFGGNSLNLPNHVIQNLVSVLKRLKLNVLWKYSENEESGNVKKVKWLPQNDILGHPKTKLFVSHCGNNGVFEALYHGMPLVCTPILGDQFFNGIRVEHWEVGKTVPLLTSSEELLFEAMSEVLKNPKYAENMKRASAMYHSKPMRSRERAAFWVEYVLKFGGSHLRSQAAEMSAFTYMGYDIVCFILILDLIIIYMLYKCTKVLCRCCRRKTPKQKTN